LLSNIDCGKSSKQWATAHCIYVWEHDLKVDMIDVKQVTISMILWTHDGFLSRRMRYSV